MSDDRYGGPAIEGWAMILSPTLRKRVFAVALISGLVTLLCYLSIPLVAETAGGSTGIAVTFALTFAASALVASFAFFYWLFGTIGAAIFGVVKRDLTEDYKELRRDLDD